MSTGGPILKSARSHIIALGAYTLLALLMTYPLALRLTTAIPGDGFDGWQNYWNLWWVKTALLDLQQSPYFTQHLYYPTGYSLLFQTLNIFNAFITLPVQVALGVTASYNFVVLFSFAMGGYGAYLLALHVLRAWRGDGVQAAAFLAGVVFSFSPFHFAHLLGHMQVLSLEWLPFYVLYLLRAWQSPQRRWGDALKAGLFLVLTGLCDWYYVLYLLLFTALAFVYFAFRRARMWAARPAFSPPETATSWGHLLAVPLVAFVLFAVALSPLLVPMVLEARGSSTRRSLAAGGSPRAEADSITDAGMSRIPV